MKVLTDLCYLLEDEIEAVVKKGDLSPTELDNVYKAVKTMNYIETIKAMKDYNDDGYSNRGRMYDSRGNYNRYDSGYSRHTKDEKIKELEHMLENASTEAERRSIMECIRTMEK